MMPWISERPLDTNDDGTWTLREDGQPASVYYPDGKGFEWEYNPDGSLRYKWERTRGNQRWKREEMRHDWWTIYRDGERVKMGAWINGEKVHE